MRRLVCRYPFEPWDCSVCGAEQIKRAPVSVIAGLACEKCVDRGMRGEPFIPLTVRMIDGAGKPDERPIVAVSVRDDQVILEDGETFALAELPRRLAERRHGGGGFGEHGYQAAEQIPPAIVITDASVDLLAYLERSELRKNPLYTWQVGLREQGSWRPEARSKGRFTFTVPKPVRFGFASQRGGRRRAKGRARWYQLIDIHLFAELPDGWGCPDARDLLAFGLELRQWANREQLPVLAGASAYGGRLLRDARFGGGWRRKVPAATNTAIRRLLPGNHYQLLTGTDRLLPEVHKFDMSRAHHHAALLTRFPHPDQLEAVGMFRGPSPIGRPMAKHRGPIKVGTDRHAELIRQPGMFIAAVSVPELVAIDSLQIPQLRKPGRRWQPFTSVELAALPAGVRLLDVWCAWSSPETDERLNEYAWWAQNQLGQPDAPAWLKPTLLAAYGMLAVRARQFRNAWRWVNRSDAGAIGWQTAKGMLLGYELEAERAREPQTVNVLARALIESRVRLEALAFARELRAGGMRPVAVYADAVFATGTPPARLPVPWRYEGTVHDLRFDSPARYRSREETRLPGTPRGRGSLQKQP